MNTNIGKALNIKKISDLRLQIAFAKEYVPTKESQAGLYKLVKTVFDTIKGIFELIQICFECLSKLGEAFRRKSATEAKPNTETITKKEVGEQDKILSNTKVKNPFAGIDYLDEIEKEDVNWKKQYENINDIIDKKDEILKESLKEKPKNTLEDLKNQKEIEDFTKQSVTPAIVHVLDKIWQFRFEVNPLSVYVIESVYKWINEQEGSIKTSDIKRDLGEKYIKEFKPIWKIIYEKSDDFTNETDKTTEEQLKTFIVYINQIFDIAQGLSVTKYEETLALQLSQTPIFHIKDFLLFQESKGQYQGDLRNLVNTIIIEYNYLFEENQLREITEWLDKSVLKDQVSHTQKRIIIDKRLIKIKSEYIMPIASAFNNYFDKEDMSIFIRLLEGEKSNYKITFNGNASQLVYAFRKIKEANIISNQKKEIEVWLINHFIFYSKDDRDFANLKPNSVRAVMSRSGTKEPIDAIELNFLQVNTN